MIIHDINETMKYDVWLYNIIHDINEIIWYMIIMIIHDINTNYEIW